MTQQADSDAFRGSIAQWLEQHCPVSQRQPVRKDEQIWGGRRRRFPSDDARRWFEAARDRGYTAPEWPIEYGGAGLSSEQAKILQQEMRRLGCRPPLYDQGLWMLGPTLLVYGNEAQKKEHLSKICRGEIRWAQGYSEPGAGSDLASLTTRAEDRGDHFVVNGSKIWTTKADEADWIFCLVRTDDTGPKQQGISFLLIDLDSPGVTISPIALINGEAEFCQTFFDNVRVPKVNLVGELHGGWEVAKELLKHERKMMANLDDMLEKPPLSLAGLATEVGRASGGDVLPDPELRGEIAKCLMREAAIQCTGVRIYQGARSGQADARLPLLMKYLSTREAQTKNELFLELLGAEGLSMSPNGGDNAAMVRQWAFDKALTIAGGTSEIQLNIIAKRALQLPEVGDAQ